MSNRKTFLRLFLIAFAAQLAVYGLYVLFGIDKTSGVTAFGQAYLTVYWPVSCGIWLLLHNVMGGGPQIVGYLFFWVGPAVGTGLYSVILAVVVVFFRRVREDL